VPSFLVRGHFVEKEKKFLSGNSQTYTLDSVGCVLCQLLTTNT